MTGTSSKWTSTRVVRTFSSPRHADASLDLQGIAVCAGDVRLVAAPGAPFDGCVLVSQTSLHHASRREAWAARLSPRNPSPPVGPHPVGPKRGGADGDVRVRYLDIWLSAAIWGVPSTRHGPVAAWTSPLPREATVPSDGRRSQMCTPTRSVPPDRKHLRDVRPNEAGARPLGRTF